MLKHFQTLSSAGEYKYRFAIAIPEWIPPSFAVNPIGSANFGVAYRLSVELLTKTKVKSLSPLSKSIKITIEKPMSEVPEQNLALQFSNRIGGLFGFGGSEYQAKAVFSQNCFYTGSELIVEVELNNTKCKKKVDYY